MVRQYLEPKLGPAFAQLYAPLISLWFEASYEGDDERAAQLQRAIDDLHAAAEKCGVDIEVEFEKTTIDGAVRLSSLGPAVKKGERERWRDHTLRFLASYSSAECFPREARDYAAKRLEELVNSVPEAS
jgi:hypothetical protein